jgi:hypothetical protein
MKSPVTMIPKTITKADSGSVEENFGLMIPMRTHKIKLAKSLRSLKMMTVVAKERCWWSFQMG